MSYSIDVNGNDNQPEWGYCAADGCKEPAYPIWYSGGQPDDPDLLLCERHIGARIAALEQDLNAASALVAQGKKLADAMQSYFNKLGTKKIDQHPERYEIYEMAEALADYGIIEQQAAARPMLFAETIAERTRRFNALLGPGPGAPDDQGHMTLSNGEEIP